MTKANGATVTDLTAVRKCIAEIEHYLDEIAACKANYMNECKEIRDEMASVFMLAKNAGVDIRAVKTLVKTRILDGQADMAIAKLDLDQLDAYRKYRAAQEAWEATPLGKTAENGEELTQ